MRKHVFLHIGIMTSKIIFVLSVLALLIAAQAQADMGTQGDTSKYSSV
jgi:hypothetical protein